MTDSGTLAAFARGAMPTVISFAASLLVLHIALSRSSARVGSPHPQDVGPARVRGLRAALARAAVTGVAGAGAGVAAALVVVLALGTAPTSGGYFIFLLAAQFYLLALAACLSSWRVPMAELVALLLFLSALLLPPLVQIGVLSPPRGISPYVLPPAAFMVDLPGWALGSWSHGGWNPFAWPGGMAPPGFGTGAFAWIVHVGVLLGLACWGRSRSRRRNAGATLSQSEK
ncbi:hypothetical protein BH23GEM11_BH23GEM11_17780 [soil metagenome]